MPQLIQYAYLQMLDLLTTVAFLMFGVQEGNPIVRAAIQATQSPVGGLVLLKSVALLLGIYCWRVRRVHLLSRVNVMFAALIVWNIVALIVAGHSGLKS
jgi:hypothetical protein